MIAARRRSVALLAAVLVAVLPLLGWCDDHPNWDKDFRRWSPYEQVEGGGR